MQNNSQDYSFMIFCAASKYIADRRSTTEWLQVFSECSLLLIYSGMWVSCFRLGINEGLYEAANHKPDRERRRGAYLQLLTHWQIVCWAEFKDLSFAPCLF